MADAPTTSSTPVSSATSNGKTGLSDAIREHFSSDAPLTQKASSFAKARPWTAAAFAGVAAIAVLNTLRGKS